MQGPLELDDTRGGNSTTHSAKVDMAGDCGSILTPEPLWSCLPCGTVCTCRPHTRQEQSEKAHDSVASQLRSGVLMHTG